MVSFENLESRGHRHLAIFLQSSNSFPLLVGLPPQKQKTLKAGPLDVNLGTTASQKARSSKHIMVVSQNRGPKYMPQHIIIRIKGTPKIVPLISGNPPMSCAVPD